MNILLPKYQKSYDGGETVIQFTRMILERQIMATVDYFDQVRAMCDYILKGIYSANVNAAKHCSAMMSIIADKRLLFFFSHECVPLPNLDLHQTLPRCYGV